MGASDLTTEALKTGDGEVGDGDRAAASNGHGAKKRKRQKALAAVAANGHVSKVALRKAAPPDGAAVVDEPATEVPAVDAPADAAPAVEERDDPALNGHAVADVARNGHAVEELDDVKLHGATVEAPAEDDLDEVERRGARVDAKKAAPRGRAAKREARAASAEAASLGPAKAKALRGRAAKRAKAAQLASPAARRAQLVAAAAELAAAAAVAEAQPESTVRKRVAKYARRLVALIAVGMVPAAVYALVVSDEPTSSLSRADASFMSAQLMTADQRVRRQLVRLRPRQTSAAVARTRDATLTARSLALELANTAGDDADLLRRALALESSWLDAVGSVLSNPRSPLRDELVTRDALLRPALDALPVPEGRRKGGAAHLVRYAKSRVAAARGDQR